MHAVTLQDLGEERILSEVVFPSVDACYGGGQLLGDDAATVSIPIGSKNLVISADPCPIPLVFDLTDPDYFHYGWMTLLINVSDLASMGVQPHGALISNVMPPSMPVSHYRRFWEGVRAASHEWQVRVAGGNIKDGALFTADCTVFGFSNRRTTMKRSGVAPGDLIFAVGDLGVFWSSVIASTLGDAIALSASDANRLREALHKPRARLREGLLLGRSGIPSGCIDASDGVLGAIIALASANGLGAEVNGRIRVRTVVSIVAEAWKVHPLKLALSWGDWPLVVAVPRARREEFERYCLHNSIDTTWLGKFTSSAGVTAPDCQTGSVRALRDLSSRRFSSESYFTSGIGPMVDWFLDADVFE